MYDRSWYINKIIYPSRIWNTQTTSSTDTAEWSTSPGGGREKHDALLLFLWMIFDVYKQEPIWASTAGDSGSCIDIPQQGSLSQYLSNDRSLHVWESVCRNPWNFFLWNQESGILDVKIWNTARDPTKDWNPESKFHWQILESSSWNPESTAWNPESKTVLASLTWGLTGRQGQGSLRSNA